jgi:integrase
VRFRVVNIDLAAGVIHVERGYDAVEGEIGLKSGAGGRKVPVAAVLRDHLAEHLVRTGRTGSARCFGATGMPPFDAQKLQGRADKAWRKAGLERVTPHECRHTFASLMIAAGVNAKALQAFMGHSSITTTLDTYGHLMPGSEDEAAGLLDAYLEAQRRLAEETARAAYGVGLTEAPLAR